MARLAADGDLLVLTLTRPERVASMHGDISLPLAAVREVAVEADALGAVHGLRSPGLGLPGRKLMGTWRRPGRRAFVIARRGMPAVRVELDGVKPDQLIVSLPDAAAVATRVRVAAERARADASARDELAVVIPSLGVRLAGTLELPAGAGPHPAVLLLPGSGEVDRDSNHRRFPLAITADLAHSLAGAGIASLRYDKRGVGGSGGEWLAAGLSDNADDAHAALEWLRSQPQVDAGSTFIAGHSEGALLVSALGERSALDGIAGVVLLSASAQRGEEMLAWQTAQIAAGLPRPVRMLLRVLRVDIRAKQRKNVAKLRATSTDVARIDGRRINARWHRELLEFDPRPGLAAIHAPVLALTGAKDLQVDPADLDVLAATVAGPVETARIPDLTHILRRDPGPPSIGAYKRLIRRPTDPEVLSRVTDWIARHSRRLGTV